VCQKATGGLFSSSLRMLDQQDEFAILKTTFFILAVKGACFCVHHVCSFHLFLVKVIQRAMQDKKNVHSY